jgi:Ca2+-binding RTX toxin-like protein
MATFLGDNTANTFDGTEFADLMREFANSDTLNGEEGGDTLDSGLDADTVNGGLGDDRLVINGSSEVVAGDVFNGGDGTDKLDIEDTSVVNLSAATINADVEVLEANGAVRLTASYRRAFALTDWGEARSA